MFIKIIFGHLIGDYILQSRRMATMKGVQTFKGLLWCILHCIIYTISVCVCLGDLTPLTLFIVFNSHFWIDRYSLAKSWMSWINGKDYFKIFSKKPESIEELLEIIFGSCVYIVTDNTFHILIMWTYLSH